MRFGLDSAGELTVEQHRSVGSTFGIRYSSRFTPKAVNVLEATRLRTAGIDLAVVFEDGADNSLLGHGQGQADAEFALKQMTAAGMPKDRPIYFAVDFDVLGQPGRTDGYFEGVKSVLGEAAGVYGGIEVVSHQLDHGVKWGWQTYAWSRGQWDTRAKLRQYSNGHSVGGVGVDYNHAIVEDFGQWDYEPPFNPHYERFYMGPFPMGKVKLNERAIVQRYDALRRRPHMPAHERELYKLRVELEFLAKRIVYLAHSRSPTVPIAHALAIGPNNWGWRFQQLVRRSRGERVVP